MASIRRVSFHSVTKYVPLFLLAVYLGFFGVLFVSTYREMVLWWGKYNLTYCYFIPFVILYVIWDRRKRLAAIPSARNWFGLAPLCLGILLYWLGELGGEFYTLYLSSWLILAGACLTYLGWQKFKELRFAFLLMLTMFPLPAFIHNRVSAGLQTISAKLGIVLIHLFGIPAFRDGNIIDLGITKLRVINAGEGLGYLLPLFALGLVLAYFCRSTFWKRVLLVISTIPLAIFLEGARIALGAIMAFFRDVSISEGGYHLLVAGAINLTALSFLLAEMWALGKVGHKVVEGAGPAPAAESSRKDEKRETARIHPPGRSTMYLSGIIVAILVLTIALSNMIDFRDSVTIKKPFSQFPMEIGNWYGTPLKIDADILDVLHLSNYAMIDYRNEDGNIINFYVAYYANQRKGESIHSPATCLRGGGYVFKQSGTVALPIHNGDGKSVLVERALIRRNDDTQLVYYWFPERGRILTNLWELKIYNFWDALTTHRTDGALVRLITPVRENEEVKSADKRLERFSLKIWPVLQNYLPGRKLSSP